MKKIVKMMALVLPMMLLTNSFAQEGEGPEKDRPEMTPEQIAQKRTEKMKEELALTADQEKQVYDINLAHAVQMKQYREEMKALREKMKAEKDANRTKIKAVLTPEQNVLFDQKAEEMKNKKEEHRHRPCDD